MRGTLTLCLMAVLGLSACSTPATPMEYVLTAEDSSFAEVLADLHEADVAALDAMEDRVFLPDHARQDSVLQAHGHTAESYAELIEMYTNDADRLVAVYNRALDVAAGR